MKAPSFQFYPDDFIGGTCDMTQAEVGAYLRLLCRQWGAGSIPHTDPEKLERIAGGPVTPDVLAKFQDGKNAKMEKIRAGRADYIRDQKERANKRWHPQRDAKAMPTHMPAHCQGISQPDAKAMPPSPDSDLRTPDAISDSKPKQAAAPLVLPFQSAQFIAAWETFNQHRAEKKQKPTPTAQKLALKKLAGMGEARAIAALDHSTANNWTGVFEPTVNGKPVQEPPPERIPDNLR